MVKNLKNNITKSKNKILKSVKGHKLLKSAKKNIKSKKTLTIVALVAVLVVLAIGFNLNRFVPGKGNVAANVNGKDITYNQLDEQYDFFFFLTGYPEAYKQIITKEAFLDQLVNEEVLLQEAAENKVRVLDKEVDEELEAVFAENAISREEFEIQVNAAGFSIQDFHDYYKKQMIITKLLNETFSDIEVTDEEAKEYYDNNLELYTAGDGQIRLRHILAETKEEAESILIELKKGKDFAKLAEEKSICPSSVSGGDLGFVNEGQMVEEFETAAFRLNVNQLSGVVETQFGFHVIKREPDKISFSEAESSIKELLGTEKQKEMLQEYLDGLKDKAEIAIYIQTTEPVVETPVALEVDEECLDEYGFGSDTVIFYHADWCPHCQNMVPVVEDLEAEGYDFHWAETTSGEGVEAVQACFGDVIQGGIPQFICAGSKEYKMGEMSKAKLKEFADGC